MNIIKFADIEIVIGRRGQMELRVDNRVVGAVKQIGGTENGDGLTLQLRLLPGRQSVTMRSYRGGGADKSDATPPIALDGA